MKAINSGFVFLILLTISACGSSGGGSSTAGYEPAELVIDLPQGSIAPGQTVFLDASRSHFNFTSPNRNNTENGSVARDPNRKIISWQWLQSSLDAKQVTLLNADTSKAVFTAPDVVFGIVDLHFALIVVDDKGVSAHKDFTLRLQGDTENAPVAAVKQIQDIVRVGDEIQLDGTASYFDDGDPLHDKFSNIASYLWSQDAADPIRARIDNASRAIASFQVETPFIGSKLLHFQLLVKDRHGRSGIKKFNVILKGDNPNLPVAVIKRTPLGVLRYKQEITLDGSKSFYDDGHPEHDKFNNIEKWQWTQDSTDPDQVALLPTSNSKVASFIIEDNFIGKKTLHFTLLVTDRNGRTDTAEHSLTIQGDSPNQPVAFIKGSDPLTVGLKQAVKLDGSKSYYDDKHPNHNKFENIISYAWKQAENDELQVTLTDADKAIVSFITPEDIIGKRVLNLTLTVTDKYQRTDTETVSVILEGREDIPPTAVIKLPQNAKQGEKIVLDGSDSHDNGRGGKLVSWKWAQKSTDEIQVALTDSDKEIASFTVNDSFLGTKKFHFSLLVTDQDGKTNKKEVEVSIQGDSDTNQPIAVIKTEGVIEGKVGLSKTVTLDASDSFYDDGKPETDDKENIVSFLWKQDATDEVQVTLTNTDKKVATFTTPDELLGDAVLRFTLTVTDKNDRTGSKTLSITVKGDSQTNTPVAKIETTGLSNGYVGLDKTVGLDGGKSFYDDGNPDHNKFENIESYVWKQRESDDVQVTLSGANTKLASFTTPTDYLGQTTLQFTLTVTDKNGRTDEDSVFVILIGRTNGKPTAVILPPGAFVAGQILNLDGSQSSDVGEGGKIVSYLWELLDVPEDLNIALASPNDPVARITAPDVVIGDYTFTVKLTVTDNDNNKHSVERKITLTGQEAYSIKGKVTVAPSTYMDSDTPSALIEANNTILTPQLLPTPVKVVGYVNRNTDKSDFYRFNNMQGGEKIRVWHKASTGTDIHIRLYSADTPDLNLALRVDVDEGSDTNKVTDRNITIPDSGDYILWVLVPPESASGAAVYNMSIDAGNNNDTVSFTPWKVKLQLKEDTDTGTVVKNPVLTVDNQNAREYPFDLTRVPADEYTLSAFVDIDGDGLVGRYEPRGSLGSFALSADAENRNFPIKLLPKPVEADADGAE